MEKEYKEYRYKSIALFFWLIMAFLFFILAFIGYFLEGDLLSKTIGISSFLLGLVWMILVIHAANAPIVKTADDEIIFTEIPFVLTRNIPVKDIIKIKMQMDRFIWPGVQIWYHHKDGIRKVRIITKSLRKEDQEEFRTYFENLKI